MEQDTGLEARLGELEGRCAALEARLEMARRESMLLRALDDVDLTEPARLIAGWIVRTSYGEGFDSVIIERQQDLGDLCGVGKTHVGHAITELKDMAKILQISELEARPKMPDSKGKLYEVLPDVRYWKVRPRCRYGADHASAIALKIVGRNRRRGEERDFDELEKSFVPDPVLAQVIGENAREAAFGSVAARISRPPEPGDAGGSSPNPPGIIGRPTAGGSASIAELVRRSIEEAGRAGGPRVTKTGTTDAAARSSSVQVGEDKVTYYVTPEPERPRRKPGKLPNSELGVTKLVTRETPPRARASDDRSSDHLDDHLESSGTESKKLSSASSGRSSDDQSADEADDSFAAVSRPKKARANDPLLGELCRAFRRENLEGWEDYWRYAIAHCRAAVWHAVEAVKLHGAPDHPGAFAAKCFRTECRRLGRPFREFALDVPAAAAQAGGKERRHG